MEDLATMNTRKSLIGALAASMLLGALPGVALAQDAEAEITPEGVEWALTTLAGDAVPAEVEATLFLSGGEVVGNAGCNSFFGSYELDGEALTFPTPFGSTLKMCEETAMAVEGAYLPLLQDSATWAIDDEGALSLADAEGAVQLVYGEAPVDITESDIETLVATLGDLQAQIDEASAEVAALAEATASIPVNKFDKRVTQVEKDVVKLQDKTKGLNVDGMKGRISELELETASQAEKIASINLTINKLRDRIKVLEATAVDHEDRIAALEASQTPATE